MGKTGLEEILGKTIAVFTSLRLTVVLLTLGLILVFLGTIAQVELGLYKAQSAYFRSFVVYGESIPVFRGFFRNLGNVPVFPGGYLVGGTCY